MLGQTLYETLRSLAFTPAQNVGMTYLGAILGWIVFNHWWSRRLEQGVWRLWFARFHRLYERRPRSLDALRMWVTGAIEELGRRLRRRTRGRPFADDAVTAIRDCARDESGLTYGRPAVSLRRGVRRRRTWLKLGRVTYRPLFSSLLHETEHLRYAFEHDSKHPGDDLMLRDAVRMIGIWELGWIEFVVQWRTNPRLHLLAMCYGFEVLFLLPTVLVCKGLESIWRQRRRRAWRVILRQERLRSRWR